MAPPTELDAPAPLLEPERYRLRKRLGRGAQGDTWLARDIARGVDVAIKRVSVRGATSWKAVELAQREAAALARLQHPNLPAFVEHFELDGALHLVMQHVAGETLEELRQRRTLDIHLVRRFVNDLSDTLVQSIVIGIGEHNGDVVLHICSRNASAHDPGANHADRDNLAA